MANYSLLYDGSNDKASVGASSANFLGLATGTVEFRFKTGTGAAYQKFLKTDSNNIDFGISQDFGGGARVFCEIGGVENVGEFDSSNYADGAWHHAAVSWDGINIRGFLDGVLKKTVAATGTQGNSSTVLYVGHSNGSEILNGRIDEVRISNVARYTATFTVPTAKFTNDANTMLLWHLDDGSGSTGADASGNGNTLNLDGTNPPSWSTDTPFVDAVINSGFFAFM